MLAGVYQAVTAKGETYYRASMTYRNKHISLGSFPTEEAAHEAYVLAGELTVGAFCTLPVEAYAKDKPFE